MTEDTDLIHSNNDLNTINQDYLRKININNLFSKPINLCFSNNRFTGALLIPEHKYNKLTSKTTPTCTPSTSSTSSLIHSMNNEFALFSIANHNCLRLISFPEGNSFSV